MWWHVLGLAVFGGWVVICGFALSRGETVEDTFGPFTSWGFVILFGLEGLMRAIVAIAGALS